MKNKLTWGIISTADINNIVIPAIRSDARCEILAVASRDKEKAFVYASQRQIPRHYGSYDELLKDKDIDAVYISLPNGLHHEWCVKSARAGKHILCEKPLATSPDDCAEILRETSRNHVFLQEGFMYRYHPQTLKILEILQSNILGEIKYIYAVFSFLLDQAYGEEVINSNNYRVHSDLGGGCLWDIGSYVVNISRLISGCEPDEVFGYSKKYKTTDVEGFYCGMLKFPNGIISQFECSYSQPQRTYTEIVGSKGTLRIPFSYCLIWDGLDLPTVKIGQADEEVWIERTNAYEREIAHFCDCILENKPRTVPLDDSINNVDVLCALHLSAKSGVPISINRSL